MSPGVEVWEKSHSALQASIVGEVHIKHTYWKFFLPRKHKEKREDEGCALLVLQSSHRHAARKRQGPWHLSHHQEWKAQQYNGKKYSPDTQVLLNEIKTLQKGPTESPNVPSSQRTKQVTESKRKTAANTSAVHWKLQITRNATVRQIAHNMSNEGTDRLRSCGKT